jgi:hypothetical protein
MAQWFDGEGGYGVQMAFRRNETTGSTTHRSLEQPGREGDFKVERDDKYKKLADDASMVNEETRARLRGHGKAEI